MTKKKVPESRPIKKIAILGTTPSRMQGPVADDSGWERWTIGPGGKDAHGWDKLFELHRVWPEGYEEYLNDLRNVEPPREVWTFRPIEGAKSNIIFPREELEKKYRRRMWFSSSIAWLIPLAIEQGATDIGLWGIDLESGEEYISQFIGCAHFIDLAILAGINIHLPTGCGLLRDPMPYPDRYETLFALTTEKKTAWISDMLGKMIPEYDGLKAEVHRQEGKLLTMRQVGADVKDIQEAERILIEANFRLGNLAANVNQLKGELSATEFYRRMFVSSISDPQYDVS